MSHSAVFYRSSRPQCAAVLERPLLVMPLLCVGNDALPFGGRCTFAANLHQNVAKALTFLCSTQPAPDHARFVLQPGHTRPGFAVFQRTPEKSLEGLLGRSERTDELGALLFERFTFASDNGVDIGRG